MVSYFIQRVLPFSVGIKLYVMELTVDQIESIKFTKIGDMFPYSLKKVEISNPMMNVYGLIRIGDYYYKQVIDEKAHKDLVSRLIPPPPLKVKRKWYQI